MLPHVRRAKAKARKRAKAQKKLAARNARLERIRDVVATRAIVTARDDVTAVPSVARGRHFRFRGRSLVSRETFDTPRPVREVRGTLSPGYQRPLVYTSSVTLDTCTEMKLRCGGRVSIGRKAEIQTLVEQFGGHAFSLYNGRPPFAVSKTVDED